MTEDRPPAVGSKFTAVTQVGGIGQTSALEITEISPLEMAIRGLDGPVEVMVRVTVEPPDDGARAS